MRSGLAARAALWGVLLFLYAPVAVLVLYSFNDARFSVGWEGFTLDWYRRLLDSDETTAALRTTLVVSLSATAVATNWFMLMPSSRASFSAAAFTDLGRRSG